jgi:carboxyl-terminal processing protease
MRRIATAAVSLLFFACGGEGLQSYKELAGKCAVDDQKKFLRSWTDDLYLWYREVPVVDPARYPDPVAYFAQLRTPAKTASGKDKDQFHFTYDTAVWQALSQSGIEAGYGVSWALLATRPPRKAVAAYTEPNSPATNNNVTRGVEVLTVDDVDLVNANDQASVDKLNAGLFPTAAGQPHKFGVRDLDGTLRTVNMTSLNVTSAPVQNVKTIDTASGKVGYMLFNDHLATAEKALIDAVNQLKAAAITDLVLDIRYNGGGYLDVASELAFMIAGPSRTSGKTFERLTFNDKHPSTDPVTGQSLSPTPFESQAAGLPGSSVPAGTALPSLGLGRVYVLTGPSTCSASESILNGLSGVDVQVIQMGATTCGKPYGFYPQDNCGTTYFSIEFQGVNAKGFGDYADGFTPGVTASAGFPGCQVSDDFSHALGDPQEARLAMALAYRASPGGSCAGLSANALVTGGLRGDGKVFKSPWRENRILNPR